MQPFIETGVGLLLLPATNLPAASTDQIYPFPHTRPPPLENALLKGLYLRRATQTKVRMKHSTAYIVLVNKSPVRAQFDIHSEQPSRLTRG